MTTSAYLFRPMSEEHASWRYEASYDFYDTLNDRDDLAEPLDPQRREGSNGAEHPFLLMTREA